jgi:crossover junction endodeoxyribonuclease RuvC
MTILGIDPGTATTGYGVVKEIKYKKKYFRVLGYGLIKTFPSLSVAERLKIINNEISKLIKKYRPEALAIENLYFFKNLKTAIPVSQAKGVIMLTAAKNKIPVFELTPLEVKLTIANFGWAKKEMVQKKLKRILQLKKIPQSDDAADALAIALTCLIKKPFQKETV